MAALKLNGWGIALQPNTRQSPLRADLQPSPGGTSRWCRLNRTFPMLDPMPLNESSAAHRCKVMIVDDHPMFRESLGRLINRDLGMSVCGEADNIR
jgi:hypothetical protein